MQEIEIWLQVQMIKKKKRLVWWQISSLKYLLHKWDYFKWPYLCHFSLGMNKVFSFSLIKSAAFCFAFHQQSESLTDSILRRWWVWCTLAPAVQPRLLLPERRIFFFSFHFISFSPPPQSRRLCGAAECHPPRRHSTFPLFTSSIRQLIHRRDYMLLIKQLIS